VAAHLACASNALSTKSAAASSSLLSLLSSALGFDASTLVAMPASRHPVVGPGR